MFMSSISAMAGIMMVGTKKTCVVPCACTASAKYRLPVMRGMGGLLPERSVGRRHRLLGEDLANALADLVDLLQRGQEVDSARLLAVVHLLAVQVDFEDAFAGGGQGHCGFAVVDRGELSRHTDGYGEVTSGNAVDDLDADFAFAHVGPPL